MTHIEATKQLMELQVFLCRGNDEESLAYNKRILDTINYFITQTIPISMIEDIEKEIRRRCDNEIGDSIYNYSMRCSDVIALIDRIVESYER